MMEHYSIIKENTLLICTTTWIHPKNITARQKTEQRHDNERDVGSCCGSGMRDIGERKDVQGTLWSDKNVLYHDCGDYMIVNTYQKSLQCN